jgi:hypothetical protein
VLELRRESGADVAWRPCSPPPDNIVRERAHWHSHRSCVLVLEVSGSVSHRRLGPAEGDCQFARTASGPRDVAVRSAFRGCVALGASRRPPRPKKNDGAVRLTIRAGSTAWVDARAGSGARWKRRLGWLLRQWWHGPARSDGPTCPTLAAGSDTTSCDPSGPNLVAARRVKPATSTWSMAAALVLPTAWSRAADRGHRHPGRILRRRQRRCSGDFLCTGIHSFAGVAAGLVCHARTA